MMTESGPRAEEFPGVQMTRAMVRGVVLEPRDPDYERARHVYNANIDRRPGVIVQCRDVADVIEGVKLARNSGRAAAVRGGGHNVAGLGTCDADVLIDLSPMHAVRVDPLKRRIRVEGGCTVGEMDHATHPYGLAVPAGFVSTTGIGGLTLGGGFGYLSREYGLTCDNLLSADVVTAEGKAIVADASHHTDLFWALRGGGGNFGVVTSFEFKAHPVNTVIGGPMFWPLEQTAEVFARYNRFLRNAPEQFSGFLGFQMIPPVDPFPAEHHLETMCALVLCHDGPEAEAHECLDKFLADMPPAIDMVAPIPYPTLQGMFDAIVPPGMHHYWKTVYLRDLSEGAIEALHEFGGRVANPHTTIHSYPIDGAVHRVGPNETAFNYRDVRYAVVIVGVSPDGEGFSAIRQWARDCYEALAPHAVGAGYVNFLMGDEDEAMMRATFGDNYDRLVEVKDDYDPNNLFRINHNIRPSGR